MSTVAWESSKQAACRFEDLCATTSSSDDARLIRLGERTDLWEGGTIKIKYTQTHRLPLGDSLDAVEAFDSEDVQTDCGESQVDEKWQRRGVSVSEWKRRKVEMRDRII